MVARLYGVVVRSWFRVAALSATPRVGSSHRRVSRGATLSSANGETLILACEIGEAS
jgi:hypothetical protein